MLKLFRKKSEKEKLQEKYRKLMEEAYRLSHSNRKAADEKTAEAESILKKIEALD
ncbi:MAG: Lacal_2735 family protein [Cyclobacteriaceae bacterium]|nr:Lacal_2735 family protein [Cyclobacteriaceae bacterium]